MSVLEQAKKLFDDELAKAEAKTLEYWRSHIDDHKLVKKKHLVLERTIVFKQQIPQDNISKLLEARQRLFFDESDALSDRLFTGSISLGQWEEQMKKMVRELNTANVAIVKGGWDEVSSRDWGRLGPHLKFNYKRLHEFSQKIANERATISLPYIRARARLYGEGALAGAIKISAPVFIADLLPWMPKDGSTECRMRCKCYWELEVVSVANRIQVVRATWRLRDAEHCEDCVARKDHVETLNVPDDVAVPSQIGGY
jgi:hypothetical protein